MDNFTQIDQHLTVWIDAHADEIVETTRELLRIPSVKGEAEPGAPFGLETRRALDFVLSHAQDYGLSTKNLDGYAGHAEWTAPGVASDAAIVGVLAHVDVVPEGDGWTHPPYGAEIHEGKIYARGVADDKGPALCALFAVRAIKECGVPLAKRLRVIIGADEESGFGCVKHYFENEEMPETGFTPDANFPMIYAEKGITNLQITREITQDVDGLKLVSLTGGRRTNVVPDLAEAVLEGPADLLARMLDDIKGAGGVTAEQTPDGNLRVVGKGVSAHGSTPDEGVNAIMVLTDALLLAEQHDHQRELLTIVRNWAAGTAGESLGIAGADDVAGPLTSNLGIIDISKGHANLTFNVRYPVTWTLKDVTDRLQTTLAETGFTLVSSYDQAPLYFPTTDPLIGTLLEVYRAETGDDVTQPSTTGGGTYARVMKHGVAFGPQFPGFNAGIHQPDECWAIEHLLKATKIYAKAIARLGNQ